MLGRRRAGCESSVDAISMSTVESRARGSSNKPQPPQQQRPVSDTSLTVRIEESACNGDGITDCSPRRRRVKQLQELA